MLDRVPSTIVGLPAAAIFFSSRPSRPGRSLGRVRRERTPAGIIFLSIFPLCLLGCWCRLSSPGCPSAPPLYQSRYYESATCEHDPACPLSPVISTTLPGSCPPPGSVIDELPGPTSSTICNTGWCSGTRSLPRPRQTGLSSCCHRCAALLQTPGQATACCSRVQRYDLEFVAARSKPRPSLRHPSSLVPPLPHTPYTGRLAERGTPPRGIVTPSI